MRNLDVGQNQNIGIGDHSTQEDVVRTKAIETVGGLKLLIGLIFDGESPDGQSPQVFQQLATMIVSNLKQARETDVGQIMTDSLNQAHHALRTRNENKEGELFLASATLAAIHQKRLFLAHSGCTRAYLVRGETAVQLTQDHLHNGRLTGALGLNPELKLSLRPLPDRPFPFNPSQNSLPLKPGDSIVLCSDGLVKERPDNRGTLLNAAKEMPPVLNDPNMSAVEAARTLVSLAVGRRADDNVSALVMRLPKQNRRTPIMVLAVVGLIGLVILFAALRIDQTDPSAVPLPTETTVKITAAAQPMPTAIVTHTPGLSEQDDGYASVQIRGSSGKFEYIPHGQTTAKAITPSTSIEADDQVFTGESSQLQLILNDGTHLFLGPGTELHFIRIGKEETLESSLEESPTTTLILKQGKLLLQQDATGRIIVIQADDFTVMLERTGTMAVSRDNSNLFVCCFAGACHLEGISISPGQRVFRPFHIESTPATNTIIKDERSEWNALCHCLDED